MKKLKDIFNNRKWQVMSNELRERMTVSGDPVNNDSLGRSRLRSRWLKACALSALAIGAFSSCSDDLEVINAINNGLKEGEVQLFVNVPEPTVVKTRDDLQNENESAIQETGNHYAFFFNQNNSNWVLAEFVKLSITDSKKSEVLKVPNSLSLDNLKIIVVANAPAAIELTKGTSTYTNLLSQLTTPSTSQPSKYFVMSGVASKTADKTYSVGLKRSVAKVSLEVASSVSNFKLEEYYLYNAPTQGFYTAASASEDNQGDAYIFKSGTQQYTVKSTDGFANYVYPVKSAEKIIDNPTGAFFVIKGKYNNEDCYYRVDLRKTEGSRYHNIEPNHWYQIEIVEVLRKGYSSADQAAKRYMGMEDELMNEGETIRVKIHDHVATIMSMTSDGSRELGVDREINLSTDDTSGTSFLTVKCYSDASKVKNASDEMNEAPEIEVISGSWLKVNTSGDHKKTGNLETSGNHTGDTDNVGVQYAFPLIWQTMYSDDEATIKIRWQGLERTVKVNYNAVFSVSVLCQASLDISGNSLEYSTDDYWTFIQSNVNGIQKSDLADGKVRDEGFHFPMPYGEDSSGTLSPCTYEYTLDFNIETNPVKNNGIKDITAKVTDDSDSYFDIYWSYNKTTKKGTLKLKEGVDKTSYNYALGALTFIIEYYANQTSDEVLELPFTVSLYHTGFFHKDEMQSNTNVFYYYEVVNLGGKYWLDRNLGATSNKMFIDNDGTNAGESKAAGLFYKIANRGDYNDPAMQYNYVCPPGYRVPNATDWDNIRLSNNFTTSQVTEGGQTYMATYYDTNGSEMGNVYFPKSRYYNNPNSSELDNISTTNKYVYSTSSNNGSTGTGYYWTTSVSSGLEKQEIGAWLQVLSLNGASNTYISGSIKNHMMNVRCIAKTSHSSDNKYAIDFNVKGATHVYLYTIDDYLNKSGIFAFPGKAIGSQSAVDALFANNAQVSDESKYLHFSYTSTLPEKELYVFFAYMTDEGKITLLSANGADNLADATGWPVKVGYNYFFDKNNNFREYPKNDEFPFPAAGTPTGDTTYKFEKGKKLTIYWRKWISGYDMYRIYVQYPDGTNQTAAFPGDSNREGQYFSNLVDFGYAEAYRYTFELKQGCSELNVRFSAKDYNKYNTTKLTLSEDSNNVLKVTEADEYGDYGIFVNKQ